MASAFLSRTAPAELVLCILDACESARDALALSSACRMLFHIGRSHAARITDLVAAAERRRELPPTRIFPGDLASSRRAPSMPELEAAFSLSRLVKLFECHLLWSDLEYPDDRPYHGDPEEDERMAEFTARLHKAFYRVLIAGAALAGAYHEPMFKAKLEPGLGLPKPGADAERLTAEQLAFLEQFAVCNLDPAPEAEEAVFGPLGNWLLETILADHAAREAMARRFREGYGRAKYCLSRSDCPVTEVGGGNNHSDAHLVVWELMQMLWAHEYISFVMQTSLMARDNELDAADWLAPGETAARAVFLGVFNTEEIELVEESASLVDLYNLCSRLPYVPTDEVRTDLLDSEATVWGTSAAIFCPWIHGCSGRPNWYCIGEELGGPVAPMDLHFFEYFLRRHLRLRLLPNLFDEDIGEPIFREFQRCVGIFSHDDVEGRPPYTDPDFPLSAGFLDGTELLTAFDPRPARVFVRKAGWWRLRIW
ncbi:uncharacterized protein THITE_2093475 [Thermothielavioides terrestris NRRL 8126]|uniref:Uncharacterized protein n=1 Tax=Thermothielavioides terrestris (strain ATCC 38088 / NRRL 8126) TaxID=578455 RepID=G2RH43_THETT|nr:uncharacterized protein THITE_2093475 [Thermothielavioides terrestris NRRL 8126]AEO71974.1 hypothetical protein THITE_2093475 [Thermothielavioides terrestris NRRL 8126]